MNDRIVGKFSVFFSLAFTIIVYDAQSSLEKFVTHRWRESQMAIANQKAKEDELKEMEASLKTKMEEETTKLKEQIEEKESKIKELESDLSLTETQFARAVAESEVRIIASVVLHCNMA